MEWRPARPAAKASSSRHWSPASAEAGAGLQLGSDLPGQGQGLLAVPVPAQQVSRGPDPCFQPDRGPCGQGHADGLPGQRVPVAGRGPGPGQAQVRHEQSLPAGVSGRCPGQRFPGDLPGGVLVAQLLQAADQRALDLREPVPQGGIQVGADPVHGLPGYHPVRQPGPGMRSDLRSGQDRPGQPGALGAENAAARSVQRGDAGSARQASGPARRT